jgi:hypothetical protein
MDESSAANEGQANYNILTVQDDPPILDKTIHNFKGLRSGGTSLVQSESVQPLQDSLNLILSKNFLYEFLCVALSESTEPARTRLTQSSLLDLPRCQSKSSENLHQYLYDNVRYGCCKRDLCIDVESVQEVPDGFEQVDKSIITRANILYCLIH